MVKAKAIAFESTITGCSGPLTKCTSANAAMLRESRAAGNHLCPADKPNVLIKANGALVCVATLPSEGPTGLGLATPNVVQAQGQGAVARFKVGEVLVVVSGCLACHRIGEAGNHGPGRDLTRVGSRLPLLRIARALVKSPAPMPSFSRMAESKRRDLAYFLAQLR
jgi:mono/diheme cytochrome c family protein